MTHLSLFSGIGGLDLAAEWAGFQTVGQCEWADYPTKVLEKHWPDVPRWRDIRDLTADDFRRRTGIDRPTIISGGFPCQPFSVAGKQKGKGDDRYLWPEMLRIIRELAPRWVVGENVPGILSIAADEVCADLERLGYEVGVFDFEAAAVGAPHRRERIAFVAYRECEGLEGWERADYSSVHREDSRIFSGSGCGREATISNAERLGLSGSREHVAASDSTPRRDWEATQSLNGRIAGQWATEPDVGRVVDGLSLELDFARQIGDWCNDKNSDQEGKPERNQLVRRILRTVWENRELAASSPELYVQRLLDSLPEVPFRDSQSRWLLGARIEENAQLRGMWESFYAEPLQKASDMQFKLLERAWEAQRKKTVGSRVDRLKCLGNAVVPQQFYPIFRAIAEIEGGQP